MKTEETQITPPANTPAATTQTPPAAVEPTPEKQAAMQTIADRVFGNMTGKSVGSIKDKKVETPPAAAAPASEEGKETQPKAGDGAPGAPAASGEPKKVEEPAKPTRPARRPKAAPTVEDITKAATVAATKAIAATLPKPAESPAPAKKPEPPTLDPTFKNEEQVYKHLAATDPKYSNLITELNDYAKSAKEYKKKWTSENPGKRFNPDDEEHAEFMEANLPNVAQADVAKASGEISAKAAVEKEMEPIRKERKEQEERTRLDKIASDGIPLVKQASANLDRSLVQELIPDAVGADGKVDTDKVTQAMEDPAISDAVDAATNRWGPLMKEAAFILRPGAEDFYSPESNPLHSEIEVVMRDLESQIDGRDHKGLTGVTREAYAKLPEDERANYYTVNGAVAVAYMNELAKREAKKIFNETIEKSEKIAQRRGYKKETPAAGDPKPGQGEVKTVPSTEQQTQQRQAPERRTVSAGGGGPTVTTGGNGGGGKKSGEEMAFGNMIRR